MKVRNLPAIGLAAVLALAAAVAVAAQDTDDPVVAQVGDTVIRQSEIIAVYDGLPAEYKGVPVDRLFNPLLDRAIDNVLIDQRVASLDDKNDAEVQMMLRLARLQILRQIYFTRLTEEAVTEAAIKAAYDERVAAMPTEEEVHARHILVSSEDEAKAVLDALAEADADFAAIAAEKSIGPSASKGGDIGYFVKAAMVPEFAEAAFAMAVGEVSKAPVQTQFGWHVIKVEDRRPTPVPTLDELREEIVAGLQQAVVDDGIAELRKDQKIERYAFDGSALPAADASADSGAPAPAE